MKDNIGTALGMIIGAFIIYVVVSLITSVPIWLLWNWLMPVVFSLPTINFLQAWGLSFLSYCLFGSVKINNNSNK